MDGIEAASRTYAWDLGAGIGGGGGVCASRLRALHEPMRGAGEYPGAMDSVKRSAVRRVQVDIIRLTLG